MKLNRKASFIKHMRAIDNSEFEELIGGEYIEFLSDATINGLLMYLENLNDKDFINFIRDYYRNLYKVEDSYSKEIDGVSVEGIGIYYGITWDI